MKRIILSLFCSFLSLFLAAQQQSDCNKLGAWLWYIDITGFQTHAQIADTLAALGIKRIFIKVADGTPNPAIWPELNDISIPVAYKAKGIEPWAWSYNYVNNPSTQANALKMAAQTGYTGFVVDVETEFDGLSTPLTSLFAAFAAKKQEVITSQIADSTFKLYCTTWGNPKDHNFKINLIDPHVDGFMPQTYVEQWGPTYVANLEYWIGVGNEEYVELGATKPIHHIVAYEDGNINTAQINSFFETSGAESSMWRIPGGTIPNSYWNTWNDVNWTMNFCAPSSINTPDIDRLATKPYPNPTTGHFQWSGIQNGYVSVTDLLGKTVQFTHIKNNQSTLQLDLSRFNNGVYLLHFVGENGLVKTAKIIKEE
jgi:hypothetical protein